MVGRRTVSPIRDGLRAPQPAVPGTAGGRPPLGAFRLMRKIDQYLGPPLCLAFAAALAAARLVSRRGDVAAAAPKRILIIKFWGMGSIVLTTPALRALKKTYPDCHITFLTFEQNQPVCRMIRTIDRVYPYRADGPLAFLSSFARLARFLRRERFDVVVDFEFFANFTSIVAGMTHAPVAVGFHSPKFWREAFYTTRVRFEHAHITENFLKAARAVGANADGHRLDEPAVSDGAAAAGLRRLLEEHGITPGDRLVCVNINASALDYKRRWPLESYRQLLGRILDDAGDVRLMLIGSPEEAPYVARLTASFAPTPALVDLCGRIGVEQLALLLQRSILFIGNDSGPLHLAAAAGIPTVSFFGPETPALYGPRGEAHAVFYAGIACSPCLNVYNSKDNSGCRNNVCMQSIGVDEAWAAVREQLSQLAGDRPALRAARSR
jgi:ADP-heptose:LPS heptosyltransferase